MAVALLLPLAAYGAYALTRDLQRERANVQVVGAPAPASNVPRSKPAESGEPPVAEVKIENLPPSRPLAADSSLPDGAVLVMSFEEPTFYEKDGKTYVRNLSGENNDAVCENVAFTLQGKCGGGLLCQGGMLSLGKSLINHQPNYTIALWCRCDDRTNGPNRIYATFRPGFPDQRVFDIGFPPERSLHVNAWNRDHKPAWWNSTATDGATVPAVGWCFLAVSLKDGGINSGALSVTIDDQQYMLTSQMVDAEGSQVADWLGGAPGAAIDELVVFQRALSGREIMAVREFGLNGTPFTRAAVLPDRRDVARRDSSR